MFCAAAFVLGASLALLVISVIGLLFVHHFRATKLAQALAFSKSADASSDKIPACGRIEAIEIPLANPDGGFPDRDERLAQPRWFFENFSEPSLTRFFNGCDLRPFERAALLDKRSWEIQTNGIRISPSEQLVWSLSHKGRQQIYAALAKSGANYSQRFPFRIPVGGFDLKFKNSGLPVEQVERIRRLTYTNAGYLCFSDLGAMQKLLKPADFNDLIETLYAIPTFMVRLRVTPDADIDALLRYWGRGGREKLIAPILTGLAKVPGGAALNISALMPSFPRLRLYTYPEAWKDPTASQQDCFFTAMNFFSETPDTNFFDVDYSRKVLQAEYAPIKGDPAFGDLVAVFGPDGVAIHACVYIADDFVFTKNGINSAQPWVLMRMADMLLIYFAPQKTGELLFLRRKDMS